MLYTVLELHESVLLVLVHANLLLFCLEASEKTTAWHVTPTL